MFPCPHASVVVSLLELPGVGVDLRVDECHVAFVGLGLLVDELKDAVGAGQTHDHGVDLLRDLADLSAELLGHVEERHHDAMDSAMPEMLRLGTPSARKMPPASATST